MHIFSVLFLFLCCGFGLLITVNGAFEFLKDHSDFNGGVVAICAGCLLCFYGVGRLKLSSMAIDSARLNRHEDNQFALL